jgi:hypothetical protein
MVDAESEEQADRGQGKAEGHGVDVICIVIADDQPLVRSGLRMILEGPSPGGDRRPRVGVGLTDRALDTPDSAPSVADA